MSWFVAKIVFRIVTPGKPQFDEHLRLIQACSLAEAYRQARMIGISEEDSAGTPGAKWEFVNVSELHEIKELVSGTEIHSSIMEVPEAVSYVQYVHSKAAEISNAIPG